MCDRVVLVLAGPTAEMLHELVNNRICTLDDTEWGQNLNAQQEGWRAQERHERRLLADVAGALKAPK
jgi:hypothetical protein